MNFYEKLKIDLKKHIGSDNSPIVIFSSLWPFFKACKRYDQTAVDELLDLILEISEKRNVLMPTFTGGFKEGKINLDTEVCTTGILAETFRKRANVKRTNSAFFSYSIIGPDSTYVSELVAKHSWGEGSVYEWMEKSNAKFIMLGTDPTHCSYLHRLEWLARNVVKFRYDKVFKGQMIKNGKSFDIEEILFVRRLDPPVENEFLFLNEIFTRNNFLISSVEGVKISSYFTSDLIKYVLPLIEKDPFCVVKNRADYE